MLLSGPDTAIANTISQRLWLPVQDLQETGPLNCQSWMGGTHGTLSLPDKLLTTD